MDSILFLTSGIVFGLTAGISPGPLFALVISETLRHSRKDGIKIAIAPLVTDLPIVLVALLLFSKIAAYHSILGAISILGGLFIASLAYGSLTAKGMVSEGRPDRLRSLRKGIIANFLNPNPYLFWMTVGAPTVIKALDASLLAAFFFMASFYVCLVGSKIILAVVVDRSKAVLKSALYLYIIRILGLLLLVFAGLFIKDGLKMVGLL
jgi:threonine/homoserine/homoserine lactone efflux protein